MNKERDETKEKKDRMREIERDEGGKRPRPGQRSHPDRDVC
jgi:hypothetical protein